MRIAWKLLILLLGLSVIPIIILTWAALLSINDVGSRVAAEVRERLIEDTSQQLSESSRFLSEVVHDRYDRARLILEILRVGVVRSLSNKNQEHTTLDDVVIYKANEQAPDSSKSNVDRSLMKGGIFLNADVNEEAVHKQLESLASLVQPLKELTDEVGSFVYTFNVGLSDGVMFYYPDRAPLPRDFDLEKRAWYVEGREAKRAVEVGTYVDAASREVVASFSQKLPSTGRTPDGVVGIELGLTELLGEVHLPSHLQHNATIALVRHDVSADGSEHLEVLAEQDSDESNWATPSQKIVRNPDGQGPWAAVFAHINARSSGVATLPIDGVVSFWSYAALDKFGTYLFIVVPESTVLKEGQEVAAMIESEMGEQLIFGIIVVVVVLIALVVAAIVGARTITHPILVLSRAANDVAAGNFDARADVRCHGEVGSLATAFNQMVPRLRDQLRMKQSLDLAHEVQARLLPDTAPVVPGLDLSGKSMYCDETGGDYFDFLAGDDLFAGTCVIMIGDVTGHGVSAALIVTSIRASLHLQFSLDRTMDEVFEETNRYLSASETAGQFMTLCAIKVDTEAKTLQWVSAGHDPPLVYDPTTAQIDGLIGSDLPIGIDENADYTVRSCQIPPPGSTIVLATDGVWEAIDVEGQEFGKDRLQEIIKEHSQQTAGEIRAAIFQAIHDFVGGKSLRDDVTIVVVKIV